MYYSTEIVLKYIETNITNHLLRLKPQTQIKGSEQSISSAPYVLFLQSIAGFLSSVLYEF